MRRFLWNKKPNERYLAQVSWARICTPKVLGGLGLKNLAQWNRAFMLKRLWDVYQKCKKP